MIRLFVPQSRYIRKIDFVVESLRTTILLGYIQPGTSITEKQIKEVLKVSSSPVREAMNQLEAEGLLVKNPHVGTKVAEIDIGDARELYIIQGLFQGTAVQLCAKHLSDDDIDEAEKLNDRMIQLVKDATNDVSMLKVLNYRFHMLVCGANVYPWLTRLISALWLKLPSQTVWLVPNESEVAVEYHKKIIEAIRKGDNRMAGRVMRTHLGRSKKVLVG